MEVKSWNNSTGAAEPPRLGGYRRVNCIMNPRPTPKVMTHDSIKNSYVNNCSVAHRTTQLMSDPKEDSQPWPKSTWGGKKKKNESGQGSQSLKPARDVDMRKSVCHAKQRYSGCTSSVKNSQRYRKRARKRKKVTISDLQRIIRVGPKSIVLSVRLPSLLRAKTVEEIVQSDDIIQELIDDVYCLWKKENSGKVVRQYA